jgi:hypothetical protein
MAPAATLSAATLDPSTLPQVSFARADDLLSHAAQLRAKAEILKSHAKENEDNAKQFEDSAAELQANAEEDREYVQAELDTTLEYHSDVLEDFLLILENQEEFKRLTIGVEEGTAYVHEVVALGERLLQLKAAKLHLSDPNEANSSRIGSKAESNVHSSSQTLAQSQTTLQAQYPHATGMTSWLYRIDSLLGRRAPDVDYSSHSAIQPDTGGGPVEAYKDMNGSHDKVETNDSHDHETHNIAETRSSRRDTSANSISTEVLQNATLPLPCQNAILQVGTEGQNKRKTKKKKSPTAEGTAISSQGVYQSHVEEDFDELEPPETGGSTSEKLKRKTPGVDTSVPDAKRRKKLLELTEKERAAAYDGNTALPRYRELFARESGTDEMKSGKAKKLLKQEMKKEVENSSKVSLGRKERLVAYGNMRINTLVKRENKRRGNAILKGNNGHGGNADLQDLYTAELADESRDEAVVKEESEEGEDGQLADLYTAELLEESADDTWWP